MTTSPLASPAATRVLLEAHGLFAKHHLGQNFLVDNHVIERIMRLAALSGSERVLEVGPGIGTLTLALVQEAAQVVSVEMDSSLEPILAEHAASHPNFTYLMGDALQVSAHEIAQAAGGEPTILVANLPYNVAATIILAYFQERPALKTAVVMVQKEVADRIGAHPGTKAYGAYTAKLALFGRVAGRFEVPPRCFMPAPHVDSAVVRIERYEPHESPLPRGLHASDVAQVIDAGFLQRRKTIRNSMAAAGFDKAQLDCAFAAAGIHPGARGETLEVSDFIRLTKALALGAGEHAS
ncbi:16S rRNA (adenine(1518)-N(6)/adenine(1519)-N(6))-dimethyltransferase RsmA [Collinsella sp. AGMB00827]|uniref:Ribosomal RNA small subunit methyltransferase A n=1 Tax=Collinsella ureilytica TaxID=2869515 RepID=A0ABS7MIM8_9ACTN|nr:16S rRNA (adenine(1518)-N(6)/adenine(1519)-N(6))-dimethyltransferase RsmA [Collinsella urealyticum]MBY4797209.1 16S rRNA (adenine(1518)-N(6)/adenine(1519)-N(6))-dimethyltransferase RsmA [Collinsella urealyticum]